VKDVVKMEKCNQITSLGSTASVIVKMYIISHGSKFGIPYQPQIEANAKKYSFFLSILHFFRRAFPLL
jgi:hypothetical protein